MRLALDTNRYTDLCRELESTVALIEGAEEVFLPFVVLGEVRAGFLHGDRQAPNDLALRRFLLKDSVSILYADDHTTHHYAALYYQLRSQGTPIPTNDIWIAALVLQHNLALHSRDAHFNHLPQVIRV